MVAPKKGATIFAAVAIKGKEAKGIEGAIEAVQESMIADAVAQYSELEHPHYADLYGLPSKCKPGIDGDIVDHWLSLGLEVCDPTPAHFFWSAKNFCPCVCRRGLSLSKVR